MKLEMFWKQHISITEHQVCNLGHSELQKLQIKVGMGQTYAYEGCYGCLWARGLFWKCGREDMFAVQTGACAGQYKEGQYFSPSGRQSVSQHIQEPLTARYPTEYQCHTGGQTGREGKY